MNRLFTIAIILLMTCSCGKNNLTILHTSDTHSHTDPESGNRGGIAGRVQAIAQITDSAGRENTLLFDCGDFSQGSLYYNCFKGSTEVEIMNAMGYDAGTIGNHELDYGLENFARLVEMAEFEVLCANYDFTGTACEGLVKPYTVIEKGGKKIGVFGLSPDPKGLVSQENYAGIEFISPVEAANKCVAALKEAGCDAIVCISHLGWKIKNEYNDERVAAETAGIDIILGGHSHDYFEQPLIYKNRDGKDVIMQQMGKNGRHIGHATLTF